MSFVAVAALPESASALVEAAALCGLTPMEARTRCAGLLPRVLVRQADEDEARRLAAGLTALGFRAFAADPRQVPGDAQRVVARDLEWTGTPQGGMARDLEWTGTPQGGMARELEWTGTGLTVTDGRGERHDCPAGSIVLVQPGFRSSSQTERVKSTERKFSMGRALLSGGLSLTKTVVTVSDQVTSSREPFLLVTRTEGLPALILYESRLNYQGLGAALQPSRILNFRTVQERLRGLGPMDDRTAQPAYLRGLPELGVDPVDLGLFLVRLAVTLPGAPG
jgi:hypothetical protein